MSNSHLANLNKQQSKAVLHGRNYPKMIHKPLLVIAGAGCGKTRVIAARVAQLLLSGIDPNRILLLTFTNRAAQEMVERVNEVADKTLGGEELRWAGTFHSVAVKLLRKYGREIGLLPSFTILDRSDAEQLMAGAREQLGLSARNSMFPDKEQCLSIYSMWINSASALKRVLRKRFASCRLWQRELERLFNAYDAAKRRQNVVDFDDMLGLWRKLLEDPKRAREIGSLFDHVLVDEYQDTNRLQANILLALKPDGRGITVVGDDAQSIYSFRAAAMRNILEFPVQFSPKAKIVTLTRNYRSTQPILSASNAVIEMAEQGYPKQLFSKRKSQQMPFLSTMRDAVTQARYVADRIVEACEAGMALNDQAVLFRASNDSAQLEVELTNRNIPFEKWGGLKFLEGAHIKDALSVLRWCQNPRDQIAALRALQLLPGIGEKTAIAIAEKTSGANFLRKLRAVQPPKASLKEWSAFIKTVREIAKQRRPWPGDIKALCDWLSSRFRYKAHGNRIDELNQLRKIAATFRSRQEFLTGVMLDPPDRTISSAAGNDGSNGQIILSTIHSAKGQEWHSVTILNVI